MRFTCLLLLFKHGCSSIENDNCHSLRTVLVWIKKKECQNLDDPRMPGMQSGVTL